MVLSTDQSPIPLTEDAAGGIRVGGTRVTLETVIAVFMAGATAEEIVQRYPSLDLGDVYLVICFVCSRTRTSTMIYSVARIGAALPMPGVFAVPAASPIDQVIEDILVLSECSDNADWDGRVLYMPL